MLDRPRQSVTDQMDAIYRWQVAIYDVTRKYYLFGRDHMIAGLAPVSGIHVLEVGCGTGRNLILAARVYPEARFYGLDVSTVMVAKAREAVRRAGLENRISIALADAADFEAQVFGRDGFDRVFLSYTLSMIPPWREALERAVLAVAPGGSLHVVDFGQQDRLPPAFKAALFAWLARFHVSPRGDLEEAIAAFASAYGLTSRFERLYRGYADHAVLTRPICA